MYTVHARKPRRFASLQEATAFANAYWRRTGNIVAITFKP